MVGVDLSLSSMVWTTPKNGQWLFGHLPNDHESARALREVLAAHGVRDRTVALCLPTRSIVWATISGLRSRSRQARKAAVLAATARLRVAPAEAIVSLSSVAGGVMYAGAERSAIEAVMITWLAAGFAVAVIEPAAVSLLRGVATEVPVVIVRADIGEVEIVAGSCDRLLFARHLPIAWSAGQAGAIRLEVDATIEAARKEGVAIERVLVSGHGDLGALSDVFLGSAREATLSSRCQASEVPSWAIAAASAALWKTDLLEDKRRPLHWKISAAPWRRVLSGISAARSRTGRTRAA
jgi:hypothetical protein